MERGSDRPATADTPTQMERERGGVLGAAPGGRRGPGLGWVVAALVLVGLVVWIGFSVLGDGDDSAEPALGATISEIADDPASFYGERVVVSGEIRERIGTSALTIGEAELLVVKARELTDAAEAGDVVQVIGTVRSLSSYAADDPEMGEVRALGLVERPVIDAEQTNVEPNP